MKTLQMDKLKLKSDDALHTIKNMVSYYSYETRVKASQILTERYKYYEVE